jgi:hypothetical protein
LNSLQNMIQNVNCHLPIKQSENPWQKPRKMILNI